MLDAVRHKLSGWKNKHISIGCRVVIIKLVLSVVSIASLLCLYFKAMLGIMSNKWFLCRLRKEIGNGMKTRFWNGYWSEERY
jgi:hypothetical protein